MDHQPEPFTSDSRRIRRALRVFGLLITGTVAALVLSWAHPQDTVWQFWAVTQVLPVFYLLLTVWAAWPMPGEARE